MASGQGAQVISFQRYNTDLPSRRSMYRPNILTSYDRSDEYEMAKETGFISSLIKTIPSDVFDVIVNYVAEMSNNVEKLNNDFFAIERDQIVSATQHLKNIEILDKLKSIKPIEMNEINPEDD